MQGTNLRDYVERSNSTILDRFWGKVLKTSSCWLWTGAKFIGGYGAFGLGPKGSGNIYAHRLSYYLKHGRMPRAKKYFICHKCDVPECVNPDHLFLATQNINLLDMRMKGRHAHGITHGSRTHPTKFLGGSNLKVKLTPEKVIELRNLYSTRQYSQYALGRKFGVHRRYVWLIINRKTWKNI